MCVKNGKNVENKIHHGLSPLDAMRYISYDQ